MRTATLVFGCALLATGCGGDGPPPEALQVLADIVAGGSGYAWVRVYDDLADVSDATVTISINSGVPVGIPHTSGPEYFLAAPGIAEGDSVTLRVTRDTTDISCVLLAPEAPGITSPAPGSTKDAATAFDVTWSAPAVNPTLYQLYVDMTDTASGDDYVDYTLGTDLSITIPGGILKPVQSGVSLYITAMNRTTDLGPHAEANSYCFVANSAAVDIDTAPAEPLQVLADVWAGGSGYAWVRVYDDLADVSDATVTISINSGAPVSIPHTSGPEYFLAGPGIAEGDSVTLRVTRDATDIGCVLVAPEAPDITSPAPGSTQDAGTAFDVTWSAPSFEPTVYQLLIDMTDTASGDDWVDYRSSPAVSISVPGGVLKTGQSGVGIYITAMNRTTDLGPHAEANSYCLVAEGSVVYINTAP